MSPKHYGIGGKDGRGRRDTRQVKLCQRRSQKRPQVSASVARAMPDPHVPASSSHPPPAGTSEGEDFLFLFFFTHGNLLPIRSDLKPRLQDLWWELNAQLRGRKCCARGVSQDTFFFSFYILFFFFSLHGFLLSLPPTSLPTHPQFSCLTCILHLLVQTDIRPAQN